MAGFPKELRFSDDSLNQKIPSLIANASVFSLAPWKLSMSELERVSQESLLPAIPVTDLLSLYCDFAAQWDEDPESNLRPSITVFNTLLMPSMGLVVLNQWGHSFYFDRYAEYSFLEQVYRKTIGLIPRAFNPHHFPTFVMDTLTKDYSNMCVFIPMPDPYSFYLNCSIEYIHTRIHSNPTESSLAEKEEAVITFFNKPLETDIKEQVRKVLAPGNAEKGFQVPLLFYSARSLFRSMKPGNCEVPTNCPASFRFKKIS